MMNKARYAYSFAYLLFMTGLIFVLSGILIVEKRANSMIKQPITIEAIIVTALNKSMEFKISRANKISIEPNPTPIKATRHNNPNNIIFARLVKSARAVNASEGNKIRKNNFTYIGRV